MWSAKRVCNSVALGFELHSVDLTLFFGTALDQMGHREVTLTTKLEQSFTLRKIAS